MTKTNRVDLTYDEIEEPSEANLFDEKYSESQILGLFASWIKTDYVDKRHCEKTDRDYIDKITEYLVHIIECGYIKKGGFRRRDANYFQFAKEIGTKNKKSFIKDAFDKNQDLGKGAPSAALKQYVDFIKWVNENGIEKAFQEIEIDNSVEEKFKKIDTFSLSKKITKKVLRIKGEAYNLIVYGTPGCGKSYYIDNVLIEKILSPVNEEDKENRLVRTTFYQDYSNSDFVGQILPTLDKINDRITYSFNPGPFTVALKKAYEMPNKNTVLVIEEINRGNAANIFGDIFQLLDRKNGESIYPIFNRNIQEYLNETLCECNDVFNNLRIPGNLYIIASMNTSDQNVFTLDNAFKRRWNLKKIKNEFTDGHPFRKCFVPGMNNITWQHFVEDINDFIASNNMSMMNEDKQIGVYFIDENSLEKKIVDVSSDEKKEEFAYKVFEYLWDDVVKIDRSIMFKNVRTFDELVEEFEKNGEEIFTDGVIKKR